MFVLILLRKLLRLLLVRGLFLSFSKGTNNIRTVRLKTYEK